MDYLSADCSQPRLSRGEYWLLETAVELKIPLSCLLPQHCTLEELFNKKGHGLRQHDVVDCLGNLLGSGLIEIRVDERPWIPTGDQIVAAINSEDLPNEHSPYYGLTAKGGACWEAFAAPDWDRFILEDFDDETLTGRVTCANRRRLETYIGDLELSLLDQTIEPETTTIQEVGNWQATYWKQIPQGFVATFTWTRSGIRHERLSWLAFSGLCTFRDRWYRWR